MRDLKQGVAKEKKRRLKQAAGLLGIPLLFSGIFGFSVAFVVQLCDFVSRGVCQWVGSHTSLCVVDKCFAAAESERLKKEFEQDTLFLEQVCGLKKLPSQL